MLKNIEDAIEQMLIERICDIGNKVLANDNESKQQSSKIIELTNKILNIDKEQLPKEIKSLIFELTEAATALQAKAEEVMYMQGLKDGLRLNSRNTDYDNFPIVLSPKDVQKILGVKINAAYRLFNSKGFPSERINGKHVIPKPRFLQWLGVNENNEI